jgi:ADP-ribose pyrophosphatase YjhB (NUDIX family)
MTDDVPRDLIAVGLIVAADGRILLQHRDAKPGLEGAGLWGLFGGHVEPGEHPTQTFLREMREELAWSPRHFELWSIRNVDHDGWHATSHAYAAHLDVPFDALVLGEGQGMALFAPDELPPNAVPSIRPVIAEFVASPAYKRVRRRFDVITATGLLVDADGRFLLQHRDDKPEIANPGRWGSFGGLIEPGETPEEGFARELQEELAWRPKRCDLYGAYPYPGRGGTQLIYVYAALVDVPFESRVLGEGQGMAYFAPDALPPEIVPDLRTLIERFVESDAFESIRAS